MAGVVKKAFKTVQDTVSGDKKKKESGNFMQGLKNWVTSPGGIITLILFIGTIIYIEVRLSQKD